MLKTDGQGLGSQMCEGIFGSGISRLFRGELAQEIDFVKLSGRRRRGGEIGGLVVAQGNAAWGFHAALDLQLEGD